MMCKQEVKDEARQNEGDPMIRQRIRTAQRALMRKRMMQDVKTADVVIVNPIHIAVAIKYDPLTPEGNFLVLQGPPPQPITHINMITNFPGFVDERLRAPVR